MTELRSDAARIGPPQSVYSRRALLAGGTAGLIFGGLITGLGEAFTRDTTPEQDPGIDVVAVTAVTNQGIGERWRSVSLFAGFVTAAASTLFYYDPTLAHRAPSPLAGQAGLGILRPIFINASLKLNDQDLGREADSVIFGDHIGANTFGFIDPERAQILYCRYDPSTMHSYSREDTGGALLDERDTFDGRQPLVTNQLSIPYFTAESLQPALGSPDGTYQKLAAVAMTYEDGSTLNQAANNFLSDPAYEPIRLDNPQSTHYTIA